MKIFIQTDDIKIGQLLKRALFISTGGQAKLFLETNEVQYNDERVKTRGTKIKAGSNLWINDEIYQIIKGDKK